MASIGCFISLFLPKLIPELVFDDDSLGLLVAVRAIMPPGVLYASICDTAMLLFYNIFEPEFQGPTGP